MSGLTPAQLAIGLAVEAALAALLFWGVWQVPFVRRRLVRTFWRSQIGPYVAARWYLWRRGY